HAPVAGFDAALGRDFARRDVDQVLVGHGRSEVEAAGRRGTVAGAVGAAVEDEDELLDRLPGAREVALRAGARAGAAVVVAGVAVVARFAGVDSTGAAARAENAPA